MPDESSDELLESPDELVEPPVELLEPLVEPVAAPVEPVALLLELSVAPLVELDADAAAEAVVDPSAAVVVFWCA
jgi:hypothetical protein